MTPLKPLLTTTEVVTLLAELGMEVSHETVRRWSRRGVLKAISTPLGRKHYRRRDIMALVDLDVDRIEASS